MLKKKNEYYVMEKFTKAELFLEEKKVIIFSDYRSMCQFDEDCKKNISCTVTEKIIIII